MALVEAVTEAIQTELDRLSQEICSELKAACPKRSGEAAASIAIEHEGEFSRFIGSDNLHLYYADQGNNQSTGVIFPVRRKALKFSSGGFYAKASTYSGSHFVREVADRHR